MSYPLKHYILLGNAVKRSLQMPIYHMSIRLYHFSPGAALLVMQQRDIQQLVEALVDYTLPSWVAMADIFKALVK